MNPKMKAADMAREWSVKAPNHGSFAGASKRRCAYEKRNEATGEEGSGETSVGGYGGGGAMAMARRGGSTLQEGRG